MSGLAPHEPGLAGISGMKPSLMRRAVLMIRLCAAWRKTSVSRTTGSTRLSMMYRSTMPGSTEGNWLTSPAKSRLPLGSKVSYSSSTERPAADAKEVGMGNPAEETTATGLKKSSIALAACQQASASIV